MRKIRNRQAALDQVTTHLGAYLLAMDTSEFYVMFGFTYVVDEDTDKETITPAPTAAEIDRMEWAVDEIRARLHKMSGKP
jgi:hypothetical protein